MLILAIFVCCPLCPVTLSLLLGACWDLEGSQVGVGVLAGIGLSTVQPPTLPPGLSCSSMAKIAACSEVKVNVPKVPGEALTLWPWGSMDATEKPLPPPAPADNGESICVLDDKGCSITWWSKGYTCCGRAGFFLDGVSIWLSFSMTALGFPSGL